MMAKQADSSSGSGNDTYSSSAELYLSEFKDAAMQDPGLAVSNFKQVYLQHHHEVSRYCTLGTPLIRPTILQHQRHDCPLVSITAIPLMCILSFPIDPVRAQ